MSDDTSTPGPHHDDEPAGDGAPNPDSGVGLGAGAASTFEPEEDAESVPDDVDD